MNALPAANLRDANDPLEQEVIGQDSTQNAIAHQGRVGRRRRPETGVVMAVYLHEALDRKLAAGSALQRADIEQAATEGAVQRLRPKLMTVAAVLASLVPILWETGVGSGVMKPIAAPIVGGITSTI